MKKIEIYLLFFTLFVALFLFVFLIYFLIKPKNIDIKQNQKDLKAMNLKIENDLGWMQKILNQTQKFSYPKKIYHIKI